MYACRIYVSPLYKNTKYEYRPPLPARLVHHSLLALIKTLIADQQEVVLVLVLVPFLDYLPA